MPKNPKVEKRPADVIGAAVKVMKVATDEIEEDTDASGVSRPAPVVSSPRSTLTLCGESC